MTDDEILARLPPVHPHLVRPLVMRLLRPVQLHSPESFFVFDLLYLVAAEPERWPTGWEKYARFHARKVDPEFVQRCYRVIQHVKAKIEWRTALLLRRLDQVEPVFCLIKEDMASDNPPDLGFG